MIVTVMEMVCVEMVGGRNKSVEIITRDDRRGIPTSLGGLPVYTWRATDTSKLYKETDYSLSIRIRDSFCTLYYILCACTDSCNTHR